MLQIRLVLTRIRIRPKKPVFRYKINILYIIGIYEFHPDPDLNL